MNGLLTDIKAASCLIGYRHACGPQSRSKIPRTHAKTQAADGEFMTSETLMAYVTDPYATSIPLTVAPADEAQLPQEELDRIDAYWSAANYLSVGQIYLLDNPLLRDELTLADSTSSTPT
jgi:hypothetical protein